MYRLILNLYEEKKAFLPYKIWYLRTKFYKTISTPFSCCHFEEVKLLKHLMRKAKQKQKPKKKT